MPATPSVPLLKQLQGAPLSLSDVGLVDPTLYRSLKWIATHSGVDALDLDFTVTETALGASMVRHNAAAGRTRGHEAADPICFLRLRRRCC